MDRTLERTLERVAGGARSVGRLLLLVATLLLPAEPVAAASPTRVVFELVPESAWSHGEPDLSAALDEGRVFLFRVGGDAEPDLVIPAGEVAAVPPGDWTWIAEAEGYVSVEGGQLGSGDPEEGMEPRRIVWPVAAACRVRLSPDASWANVHRLDVVSLSRGSTYPVFPRDDREMWAPAGRLLAYGVGATGMVGIDLLSPCRAEEELTVEPPSPPPASSQDFMVQVRASDELRSTLESADAPLASLDAPDGTSVGPTARLRLPGRYTYFFLDVAAEQDFELTVSHPQARTIVEPVESLGGSARALTDLRLRSRPDLAFEVDYRPAREHAVQQIEVAHCGRSRRIPPDLATCRWRDHPLELRPGVHRYRIESLDTGRYVTRARIDDEIVSGIGHSFNPYLAPDADEPAAPVGPMLLKEMEIFGHILDGDDPVRGEVVLASGVNDVPKRRFPTDEDLFYHLYYFGREPWSQLIRDEDRDRPAEELLGLYYHYTLGACDAHYYCRFFNPHSTLRGEGRLDLPLGDGRRLQVTVADAETGDPIEAASVAVPAERWTLRFVDGEVERGEPFGVEPTVTLTNANGLARVRLPEDRGDWITVHKDGFEQKTVSVQVAPSGSTRLRVRLTPDSDSVGAEIRLADGRPLAEAALLAFGESGGRDPVCHGTTNRYGRVELPDRCREGRLFVVVHPEAALTLLRSDLLASSGRPVLVDPVPRQPLTARLVDASGQPLVDVPVEIGLGPVRLDANDLLAAVTKAGYLPFYRTDGKGELVLRGVDPDSSPSPVLISPLGPDGGTESLAGYEPGDTVLLRVTGPE